MNSEEWFREMARQNTPQGWDDLLAAAREVFGKGATRWLADQAGVDIRQPQRWYRGASPGSAAAGRLPGIRAAIGRMRAADAIRGTTTVRPGGDVAVMALSSGTKDGTRRPGAQTLGSGYMGQIADAVAAGDMKLAGDLLDDGFMNIYGGDPADVSDGLSGVLGVSDWQGGFELE